MLFNVRIILKKPEQSQKINLLDLKPFRNLKWETGEKDSVILLVPKFHNRYLVKYILPQLRKPFFHIKLDEHGSFIWNLCNGNKTVGEISDKIKEKFGDNFDPTYERIGKFVNQLVRDKFLALNDN
jgi:hypothetical protein